MSAVDGREVHLDLRLVPAALTSWAVTAAGILWSIGGVVVVLVVAIAAADRGGVVGQRTPRVTCRCADDGGGHRRGRVGRAWLRRRGSASRRPGEPPSDRRPLRHRRRRHRHANRDAAVAGRRQDDVPRIATGRRRRRNVRPGSRFRLRRRLRRADRGPARRVRGPDRQADAARSHRRRSVGNR